MDHLPALPADPVVRLPVDAADATLREAIAELDPEHRLGSAERPIFLTAWLFCPRGSCLSFLGTSPAGSGLAFSCDPSTGRPGVSGSYLAQGSGSQLLTAGGVDLDDLIETQP